MGTSADIELLAPAGSFESLEAAIQAGADAVYFGVEKLNMRARSSIHFSLDDLESITERCRKSRIHSYLTLNTALFDSDMVLMREIIDRAAATGVTAIIASDLAAIQYAREKNVRVHMSTQVNISNLEAVQFYSRFADVMILARELNLDQVQAIAAGIAGRSVRGPSGKPVKLEMFVHGALCMAISGKCYLSLHEMNAPANRGECLQTCRRAYTVRDKETGYELDIDHEYIMSPRDLCTIHFLNKILDSGVQVLKIEGRARSAEYVKVVTSCYAEAIRAWEEGSYTPEKIRDWEQRLTTVFNRGFWDGYYLGQRLGEWTHQYGSMATRQKNYVGKVVNYYPRIGVAEIRVEAGEIACGGRLLIMGPTTGVLELVVREVRVDTSNDLAATRGEICSIPVDSPVRRNDKVYAWLEIPRGKGQ